MDVFVIYYRVIHMGIPMGIAIGIRLDVSTREIPMRCIPIALIHVAYFRMAS